MNNKTRRYVLALSASTLTSIAGCQEVLSTNSNSADSTETNTTEFRPSVFEASASVRRQPSADHPPTIQLALENTGDTAWPVRPADHNGYPMEGVLAWPDGRPYFVWIPPESGHVSLSERPDARRDGCWRLPEGARPAVADIRQHRTIGPGESFAVTHDVFFHGSPEGCFSAGEYSVDASFTVAETGEDGPEFGATFRLTVAEDGTFSMSAETSTDSS